MTWLTRTVNVPLDDGWRVSEVHFGLNTPVAFVTITDGRTVNTRGRFDISRNALADEQPVPVHPEQLEAIGTAVRRVRWRAIEHSEANRTLCFRLITLLIICGVLTALFKFNLVVNAFGVLAALYAALYGIERCRIAYRMRRLGPP